MLQKEFEDRTSVSVSPEEYQAIEIVYMASDLDKDEFCKMWRKMNADRVKAAQKELRQKVKEAILRETLFDILARLNKGIEKAGWDYSKMPLSVNFLSEKYKKVLSKFGIMLEMTYKQAVEYGYPAPRQYTIDETSYHIRKFLNIA